MPRKNETTGEEFRRLNPDYPHSCCDNRLCIHQVFSRSRYFCVKPGHDCDMYVPAKDEVMA